MIYTLPKQFIGIGEVKGREFTQLHSSETAYLYKSEDSSTGYEVFEKKVVSICLDFKKRLYSDTEFKEKYPKATHFGKWAWFFTDYELALQKFQSL